MEILGWKRKPDRVGLYFSFAAQVTFRTENKIVLPRLTIAPQKLVRMLLAWAMIVCLGGVFQSDARAQQDGGTAPRESESGKTETRTARLPRVETLRDAPSDAIVVFDGKNTDMLVGPDGTACRWPVEDGALCCDTSQGRQARQGGLWTKLHFKDAQIHAEVFVPATNRRGQSAGNSGLYIHGLFEMQVLDSYNSTVDGIHSMGAIYSIKPPLVNAARPAGNWESYDIIYHAPKRNEKGEPIEAGSITALLNGVLVQDHTPVLKHVSTYAPLYAQKTPYSRSVRESLLKTGAGPLQIQDHDSPVKFRNVWIRPLDKDSFVFAPKDAAASGSAESDK